MLLLLLTAVFLLSFAMQWAVVRQCALRPFCMDSASAEKPQRFHSVSVPRSGGLGIFLAAAAGMLVLVNGPFLGAPTLDGVEFVQAQPYFARLLVLSAFPVFLAGFFDDIRTNLNYRVRFALMALAAALAAALIEGAIIYDVAIFSMPVWLAFPFTVFALVGLANAMNIIDGFNGLAAGTALIIFAFFAVVSFVHGDALMLAVSLIMAVAVLGFFVWNFPWGRIFLGDGGAYFTGFMAGLIAVLIVSRNPGISPWYPIAALSYPIFEVLFSIWRKRVHRKGSAFVPDKVHLHMLIFKRMTRSNPRTSLYLWSLVAPVNALAFIFRSNTAALMIIFAVFALVYVYVYRVLVRFRNVPVREPRDEDPAWAASARTGADAKGVDYREG